MEFLTGIFGDPVPVAVKLVMLTIVLVAMLMLVFWVFRKFVGSPAIKAARGRQPRLAVTDAANLDDKRRLVLVRRDDVEHLVMIGGATDILIESNIIRAAPSRPGALTVQEAPKPEVNGETEASKQDHLAPGIVAVGAVAATALSVGVDTEKDEPVDITTSGTPTIKEATTVEEIKEVALAEASLENEDFELTDVSLDIEDALSDIGEIEPEAELPPETIPAVKSVEIEPAALSNLEGAPGEELLDERDDVAKPEPIEVVAEVVPEVMTEEVAVAEPGPEAGQEEAHSQSDEKTKEPDMEDEMQKLLDELSGEKA